MTVRDILHHLNQIYGTQLSHEQVSRITDQVMEEVKAWQTRPLDPTYAVVFLDAIVVKVRDNNVVANKPAYLAVGIDTDGEKHVLGIWLARTPLDGATAGEGARFWASVTADLRNRGVADILIAAATAAAGREVASLGPGPWPVGGLEAWRRPGAVHDPGKIVADLAVFIRVRMSTGSHRRQDTISAFCAARKSVLTSVDADLKPI